MYFEMFRLPLVWRSEWDSKGRPRQLFTGSDKLVMYTVHAMVTHFLPLLVLSVALLCVFTVCLRVCLYLSV